MVRWTKERQRDNAASSLLHAAPNFAPPFNPLLSTVISWKDYGYPDGEVSKGKRKKRVSSPATKHKSWLVIRLKGLFLLFKPLRSFETCGILPSKGEYNRLSETRMELKEKKREKENKISRWIHGATVGEAGWKRRRIIESSRCGDSVRGRNY